MSRKIFEETTAVPAPATTPGQAMALAMAARQRISSWLLMLAALVVLMIAVGGMTRLTDSGLSITEWRPITGVIPPLNDADWQSEFAKYQQIPEFKEHNHWMKLDDFKTIYWWEWGHRFLGRLVGLVWAVGFVWFAATRQIPVGWTGRLLMVGGFGALQGVVGWWMVYSGLSDRTDVAPYRLATHLLLAFVILAVLIWFVMLLRRSEVELMQARRRRFGGLIGMGRAVLLLTFVQIGAGALVAGVDAGRQFTDWPLMGGQFFPDTAFDMVPAWHNWFENAGLTQFNHRMLAYALLLVGVFYALRARRVGHRVLRRRAHGFGMSLLFQVVIGIVTLVHAAPVSLALLHQLGAVLVLATLLRLNFEAAYPTEERIAG